MRAKSALSCVLVAVAVAAPCHAQEATDSKGVPEPSTIEMDTVVVAGAQPGPGMWKVSKGDHVLWILGTVSPLPSGMEWKADEVVAVLKQSGAVLAAPSFSVDADIGLFRGLFLLPTALKAGKNPDGKTLKDVLPASLYERWVAIKPRYFGRDGGIEKKRPLLVANELYHQANRQAGLGQKPVVSPVIDGVLKERGMKPTPTAFKIRIEDPKAAIKEFSREGVNDQDCFRTALERVEKDMPTLVARANAWAVGNIEALRALPVENQQNACLTAFVGGEYAKKRGITDVEARVRERWLEVAEAALEKNRVTFATLPMDDVFEPGGYLAALQAKGYVVEAPE